MTSSRARYAPIAIAIATSLGCGSDGGSAVDASPDDAPAAPRVFTADVTIGGNGISDAVSFVVPERTRSATIVVQGAEDALFALASLATSDGAEHVGIDLDAAPGPAMQASYNDEQIGQMPGGLYQSIRLGTFTQVFPYRPDQTLPQGTTTLRVASDRAGAATVTVLFPEDDGAAVLHLNLFAVTESFQFPMPLTFVDDVQAIFDQAGIQVVIDDVIALPGTGLSTITDFTEPQERPDSMSAMLPALAVGVAPGALDVFVVDSLPFGVGGLSLGTPGPPLRGSYYYGVVLRWVDEDAVFARILAHEASHFLGLQHVENIGISGTVYPDPLDDTTPGQGNLMENGTTITSDQTFTLSRSALLAAE